MRNASEERISKNYIRANYEEDRHFHKRQLEKKLLTSIHTDRLLCHFMGILRNKISLWY